VLGLFYKEHEIKIKISITAMKRNSEITPEIFKLVRKSLRTVEMDRYVFVVKSFLTIKVNYNCAKNRLSADI